MTDERVTPDGVGRYRHYENGSIHWHPDAGAHETHGWIREKWAELGWERSFLGYPVIDEKNTPDGTGDFQHFQGGSIYSHSGGAFEVHGAIRAKWASFGWERSFLGYPVTDERTTPDGEGRFNHFQNGSIYWHPDTGAHELHGWIRQKWASLGWERSVLGYPLTDEKNTPDGEGDFQQFQWGHIHSHGNTGAHETHGAIREFWAQQGWEQGPLGYPMSDELSTSGGGRYSIFEGGVVYWHPEKGAEMANYLPVRGSGIVQQVDDEVAKLIEGTALFYAGATEITAVHHWYEYGGTRYYRVLELDFDLEAEVRGFNPSVDLDLFLAFEARDGNVVVSIVRERHHVDSAWWQELLTLGFQEIVDHTVSDRFEEKIQRQIGQQISMPATEHLLAAQLQDDGELRLYLGA